MHFIQVARLICLSIVGLFPCIWRLEFELFCSSFDFDCWHLLGLCSFNVPDVAKDVGELVNDGIEYIDVEFGVSCKFLKGSENVF